MKTCIHFYANYFRTRINKYLLNYLNTVINLCNFITNDLPPIKKPPVSNLLLDIVLSFIPLVSVTRNN